MRYKFAISHVPGTSLKVADALSRAPVSTAMPTDVLFQQETAAYVDSVVKNHPATDKDTRRKTRSAKKLFITLCQNGPHSSLCVGS